MIGRLLAIGTLVLAAGGFAPAAQAAGMRPAASDVQCGISYNCRWVFYNNPQHSQEVGFILEDCGFTKSAGETTDYYDYYQSAC
jgi:hypothetical protein